MWLIYALGGGWGHVTRGASLARAAAAPGRRIRILSNSPFAPIVRSRLPEVEIRAISPSAGVEAVKAMVLEELAGASRFIVDTFPRGLGGELADVLPSVRVPKVLIHRDLNPRYVESAQLAAFVERHYTRVLVPGEGEGEAFAHLPGAVTTAPWLIRSSGEIAGERHGGVLVCTAGRTEEAGWYAEAARELRRRGLAVREASGEWPAINTIAGAGAVIGGGGYNTVNECLALGVPLVARPWPRKYDRQRRRLERAARNGRVSLVGAVEEACVAASAYAGRPRPVPLYSNGAAEAARLVGELAGGAV